MSAEIDLQKAIFQALSGLGLTVYDAAPQAIDGGSDANWPYVEIGFISMAAFDTANSTGFDAVARIHTRSKTGSMAECKGIQGQIYERLHRGGLTLTGLQVVTMQRELSRCDRVPDSTMHGVCEYRVILDKI